MKTRRAPGVSSAIVVLAMLWLALVAGFVAPAGVAHSDWIGRPFAALVGDPNGDSGQEWRDTYHFVLARFNCLTDGVQSTDATVTLKPYVSLFSVFRISEGQ